MPVLPLVELIPSLLSSTDTQNRADLGVLGDQSDELATGKSGCADNSGTDHCANSCRYRPTADGMSAPVAEATALKPGARLTSLTT